MRIENRQIDELLSTQFESIASAWTTEVESVGAGAVGGRECNEILEAFAAGIRADGDASSIERPAWSRLRDALSGVSREQAARGMQAGATARFMLALKRPFFSAIQEQLSSDTGAAVTTVWHLSTLVDQAAQFTVDAFQRSREEVIVRQQQELLELSTPVVKLWDGVLAVPMIGTLDSSRTQLVMESLLQRIVDTGSEIAIIDITGVPTVDTMVAQHLLKTVTAIHLMGAECIISGIRPQIAQTIVHLGIDLQGVATKSSLADALALAMKKSGYTITRAAKG